MKKFFVSVVAVLALAFSANAANYAVDDAAIDALVESSVEVSPALSEAMVSLPVAATNSSMAFTNGSNPIAAFLLCFFLGGLGIHRHYMGTRPFMWLIYFITFGGIFGVVPLIDWIFLLIGIVEDDISQYCGNTSFFMWA